MNTRGGDDGDDKKTTSNNRTPSTKSKASAVKNTRENSRSSINSTAKLGSSNDNNNSGNASRWKKIRPSSSSLSSSMTSNAYDETTWIHRHPSPQVRNKPVKMTVIILTMERFDSLQRLIASLHDADYTSKDGTDQDDFDRIDVVLRFDNLPPSKAQIPNLKQERKQRIQRLCKESLSKWKYGDVHVVLSRQNVGLAESWFRAWRPSLPSSSSFNLHNYTSRYQDDMDNDQREEPRALILEDDLELSPIWYQWLRGVHDAYGGRQRSDLASFSLSHQELVPLKDITKKQPSTAAFPKTEPFLYALLGSHGFSPIAHVWIEFIDFVRCAHQQSLEGHHISVLTPGLVTSDWFENLDRRGMWTQHFIYFCKSRGYYNMYQFPPSKALAAHWQEKGEHFDGSSRGRNFDLVQDGDIPLVYPNNLQKYDWGANLVDSSGVDHTSNNQDHPVVVMSAAVGYGLNDFYPFVESLRSVYYGDVVLLISESASTRVRSYLQNKNIRVITTKDPGQHCNGCEEWEQLNRARFSFFKQVCDHNKYSLCLTTDFRDSIFQSNPFEGIDIPRLETQFFNLGRQQKSMLFVYEHNTLMNQWHYEKMHHKNCGLYGRYRSYVEKTNIINGGSLIASPDVFMFLVGYISNTWKGCNDQVVLNILVRAKMMPQKTVVTVSPQGVGNMNVVGYGGKIIKGVASNQFLNLNCFPSPVVHQYDKAM